VALGFFLARRGMMAMIAVALTGACVVGFGVIAFVLAHRNRLGSLSSVPLVASTVLAYGVGVLVAFTVASRVFRRDEDDGVRALFDARGVSTSRYLFARVAGLAILLALLVGGGSLATGLLALLASRSALVAAQTVQASVAAVVFGLAFALVFAPVALATLGARSRGAGYLALLAVLLAPELLEASIARVVPLSWVPVCSLPGALVGLRTSLAPVGVDLPLAARSIAVLLAVIGVSLAIVRLELVFQRRSAGAFAGENLAARRP